MRNILPFSLAAVAALAVSGAAYAQAERAPTPRPDVTRAQIQDRTTQAFARMDANKDGVLDQADREAREKAMFDRIDADHDGAVTFAEFDAQRANRRDQRQDLRADGRPQRAERRGARGPGLAMRGHRGPGMAMGMRGVGAADADKDGTVTQAEFTGAALARFDHADANKDGKISGDERRGLRRPGFERGRGGQRPAPQAG